MFQQRIGQTVGRRAGLGGVLARGVALFDEFAPQGEQILWPDGLGALPSRLSMRA